MEVTAHAGETRGGQPLVELRALDKVIAKLYLNDLGTKLRLVFSEYIDEREIVVNAKDKMIELKLKGL